MAAAFDDLRSDVLLSADEGVGSEVGDTTFCVDRGHVAECGIAGNASTGVATSC